MTDSIDLQYIRLAQKIMNEGLYRKSTRGGVGTKGLFGETLRYESYFPLLTCKKMSWKNVVMETLWFLRGDPTVDFLHKHGCKFWDPWVREDGTVPSAYGYFWRNFNQGTKEDDYGYVDQIQYCIDKLAANPDTRQALFTAWDPRNATQSSLPPCHVMGIFSTTPRNNSKDGKGWNENFVQLNMQLVQRSCDVALGLPYNIATYSIFLNIIAGMVSYARCGSTSGVDPGQIFHTLTDAHLYTTPLDQDTVSIYDHIPEMNRMINDFNSTPRGMDYAPMLFYRRPFKTLQELKEFTDTASTEEILERFTLSNEINAKEYKFKAAV